MGILQTIGILWLAALFGFSIAAIMCAARDDQEWLVDKENEQ